MKLLKNFFLLVACFLLSFACVPRKKLIYLQPEDSGSAEQTFTYNDEEYKLRPKDVISLNIFSLTPEGFDFSEPISGGGPQQGDNNKFVIDNEGMIELPAAGKTEIAGLTIQQAQDKVRELLEEYLSSPLIRITLKTPFVFSVLGEANFPGRHEVIGKELNIMEAIAHSGDLTRFADRSNVRLLRKEDGKLSVYPLDLLDDKLINTDYYQLKSEDIIMVDPLPAGSFRENQLFVLSSIIGAAGGIAVLLRFIF